MTEAMQCKGDGLSELDIELLLADELEPAERLRFKAHLDGCGACTERMTRATEMQKVFETLPLPVGLNKTEIPNAIVQSPPRFFPANRPFLGVLVLFAAMALAFIVPRQGPSPEAPGEFRVKGNGIELQVFVHDGKQVRPTTTGDVVRPGEQLGFRYKAGTKGHLMIVGVDGAVSPYLCFPQGEQGRSAPVFSSEETVTVKDAIRLDEQSGQEVIVALLCEEPFSFSAVKDELVSAWHTAKGGALPVVRSGCSQQEVRLNKKLVP